MARNWIGKWALGRVRTGQDGEKVWVIEGMRREVRYSISLPVQGEPRGTDAKGLLIPPQEVSAEAALFERDPAEYKAKTVQGRDVPGDVVGVPTVCAASIIEFQEDRLYGDHPVTAAHVRDMVRSLNNWMVVLKGKDLSKVTLGEYKVHLKNLKPRRQHARDLRSFTHWMRREGRLASGQDASRDLEIPQPRSRRSQGSVGYSIERVAEVYGSIRSGETEQLSADVVQAVRDVIALRALTGMHHTEVERLARGNWKVRRLEGFGEIAGTVVVLHKRGVPHPLSLCAKALAAAERLQKRGSAPEKKTVHRVIDACVRGDRFRPGELRHSFATWADQFGREVRPAESSGVPRDLIARVMSHRSVKTTAGHYIDTQVPPMIALPLVLENKEDPPISG